jgi:hypothetical protein
MIELTSASPWSPGDSIVIKRILPVGNFSGKQLHTFSISSSSLTFYADLEAISRMHAREGCACPYLNTLQLLWLLGSEQNTR